MNHLTPDEIVDGVDNSLASDRRAHLNECGQCRQHVDDARRALYAVRASDVPEPSPLFWTHFSARVKKAVADDPRSPTTWRPAWVGWRVAVPIAALALLVAALVNAVPRAGDGFAPTFTIDRSVHPSVSDEVSFDDASWQLVSDLAEDMDLDEESHAGFVIPGSIERAASDLDPAERAELLRLLRAELGRPES